MRKSEELYNVLLKYIQMLDLLRFDICYLSHSVKNFTTEPKQSENPTELYTCTGGS
jgi:hypothetical protein